MCCYGLRVLSTACLLIATCGDADNTTAAAAVGTLSKKFLSTTLMKLPVDRFHHVPKLVVARRLRYLAAADDYGQQHPTFLAVFHYCQH